VASTVFMPVEAPLPKLDATVGYGARSAPWARPSTTRWPRRTSFAEEHDAVFVHPFDHPDIIAGQGTLGLEVVEQVPDFGTVVVCLGGGGLLSGSPWSCGRCVPTCASSGVQAAGCASFAPSLAAGHPLTLPDHLHDRRRDRGQAAGRADPGARRGAGRRGVTVTDDELASAVVLLLERAKLVAEPAGAAAVAALLAGKVDRARTDRRDAVRRQHRPARAPAPGHRRAGTSVGRYATLRTRVTDAPGGLSRLLALVAEQRANVVGVAHHRLEHRLELGQVDVVLELETRGHEHVAP
jgi:threonine dehydratase